MRRWVSFSAGVAVASAVTVTAALAAACGSARSAGDASLDLAGRIQLTSASRQTGSRTAGGTVHRGETVKVTTGEAVLSFGEGRRLELRRGAAVKVDEVPVLVSGDALMLSDGAPFRVKAAGTAVSLTDGVARLTRTLGVEAASYRGTLTVSSAGRKMTVVALRRATVAALGVLPHGVEPVRMRTTDAWDRRFLGDAMEITDDLQTRSDGITAQLADRHTADVAFFTDVLPELQKQTAFTAALLNAARPAGETLVGAAITAETDGGPFATRWDRVFRFRDAGASWGLVALDQKLGDPRRVSASLDSALGRAQSFTVQALAAAQPVAEVAPAVVAVDPQPNGSTPTTVRPALSDRTQPTVTTKTAEPPEPGADHGAPIQDTLGTVGDLVGGLLNALAGK